VAANCIVGSLVDSNKVTPLFGSIDTIVHNLTLSKLGLLLEDLLWGISAVDIGVVDIRLSHNTENVLLNPSPEPDWLVNLTLLDLCLGVKIEYLDHGFGTLSSSQSDNVLGSMHEDSFSLHWLPFECKVFRRVNDGAISLILDTNVFLTLKCN